MNKHILLFDEGHDLFGKASLLGSLDSSADDFCNSLQDLAMIPPVLPLSQQLVYLQLSMRSRVHSLDLVILNPPSKDLMGSCNLLLCPQSVVLLPFQPAI